MARKSSPGGNSDFNGAQNRVIDMDVKAWKGVIFIRTTKGGQTKRSKDNKKERGRFAGGCSKRFQWRGDTISLIGIAEILRSSYKAPR